MRFDEGLFRISMRSRIGIVAMIVLALSTPVAAARRSKNAGQGWVEIRSANFLLYSNAPDRVTRKLARDLERLRATQLRFSGANPTRTVPPPTIFLFRDTSSFRQYREAIFQRPAGEVAGAFIGNEGESFVAIDMSAGPDPARVVHHELLHAFIHTRTRDAPLWYQEGIAELFSTFESTRRYAMIGKPIPEHLDALHSNAIMPLRQLFAITSSEIASDKTARRREAFYAQSWLFVHYFLAGNPARASQLNEFVRSVAAGRNHETAFESAFGESIEQIDKKLRIYLELPWLSALTVPLEAPSVDPSKSIRKLAEDEALCELGIFLMSATGNVSLAAQHFSTALDVNPHNARAHALLASLLERKGQREEARTHFERAVELSGDDPVPYLLYGEALLGEISLKARAADPEISRPTQIARARELFLRGTQLDPRSSRAWAGLGETYRFDHDNLDAGIRALETSLALAPQKIDVAAKLLLLYLRQGKRVQAERLMSGTIAPLAKDEQLRVLRRAFDTADIDRARKLALGGRLGEARAILMEVEDRTADASLKQQLQVNRSEIERAMEENRLAGIFNEAVVLVNDLDYERAIVLLEQVISQGEQETALFFDAQQLRAKILGYLEAARRAQRKKRSR